MDFCLKEGERSYDLEISGLKIIQSSDKFRFGMDAVLLSGFARVKKGERVADLGTGTGIIPLLLYAKTEAASFVGLEIQKESVDMARRSIAGNKIPESSETERTIKIVEGDIKEAVNIFGKQSFDIVTSNPPYMTAGHGIKNPEAPKSIARHEVLCTLSDVVKATAEILKPDGRFFMIHRPFRLPEIFEELRKNRLEPKRMRLVHPYADKEPNMVMIEAVKYGKPRLEIEKPLFVFVKEGEYSEELKKDYGF